MSKAKYITKLETRIKLVSQAVEAQANDETLWVLDPSIGEAYMQQSLRWLHRVIEDGDEAALASIIEQAEDRI